MLLDGCGKETDSPAAAVGPMVPVEDSTRVEVDAAVVVASKVEVEVDGVDDIDRLLVVGTGVRITSSVVIEVGSYVVTVHIITPRPQLHREGAVEQSYSRNDN
jgi:hypothetical protein